MKAIPKTTIINERHDYTGAVLVICLSTLAVGYFLFRQLAGEPPRHEARQVESRSVAIAAYEIERTKLTQLQSEIIRLRKRYDDLDPRMVKLRNELAKELQAKFLVHKLAYEGSYLPLKRRLEGESSQ